MKIVPVKCTNCGRDSKPKDEKSAWVVIELTTYEHCGSCSHDHKEEQYIRFCSTQCLILFVSRSGERIIKFEQDMLNKVRTYSPDYVNPLYDPKPVVPDARMQLTDGEKSLITEGMPIHAIKEIRTRTGMSLKDAKDIVDRYRDNPDKYDRYNRYK